jgi:DNA mismatch repair protein MutS2
MEAKYQKTLEYDKILERLAQHTSFSAGRELALALQPSTDPGEVRRRQQETSEARSLQDVRPDISLGGARDVRPLVGRARLAATLLPGDFLEIRDTLVSARGLKRTLTRLANQYPRLAAHAQWLEECTDLVNEIGRCIDDRGQVQDSASPALARIRQELSVARDRLMERLQRLIGSSEVGPYLQEALITQRSGRYVIPVKAEAKSRVQGIVHDESASGATLFIEPLATVELNNRWRELELQEQHEIERILAALTAQVAENGDLIERTVEMLAQLDLAFARGRYSYELRAVAPRLWERGRPVGDPKPPAPLALLKARHPLLPPETVVAIDVWLGGDFRVLVITGPNTGGKTVALKTVGLLTLMHQAGLHLPVDDGSILPVFDGVYADIGDEQSIEQSLSTFSSHMSTIIGILQRAGPGSLVLLDELGAGTDPVEGSALARAIIGALLSREDLVAVATTHYSDLKLFAYATPGVSNASVEFDVETLSPTYELSIGLPGRSNALAIARRLGLPMELVEEATALVAPADREADALLGEIKQAREEAQAALRSGRQAQDEAEELRRQLSHELAVIDETRRQSIEEAQAQVQRELEAVRAELRSISAGLATETLTQEWLRQASERVRQLEKKAHPAPPPPPPPSPEGQVEVGDTVLVTSLGQTGELLSLDGDEAEVRVGSFRLRTRAGELELRHRAAPRLQPEPSSARVVTAAPSPGMELDLRGQRVDEALPEVDKYLDSAYLAGLPYVRIIHGKGTGVLRKVVREALAEHPLVASYRAGEREEGGDGVTVAKLAALA